MIYTIKKPAGNKVSAWELKEEGRAVRYFGNLTEDRLDFLEASADLVGTLRIRTEDTNKMAEAYIRKLDLETLIASAEGEVGGEKRSSMAFAAKDKDVFYYELRQETNSMNLRVEYKPRSKRTYLNYNIGGMYFEMPLRGRDDYILGKCELCGDGFPKADEGGITIRNASRLALRIYLKHVPISGKDSRQAELLEHQMQMNRHLAKLDSISREGLIKAQEASARTAEDDSKPAAEA